MLSVRALLLELSGRLIGGIFGIGGGIVRVPIPAYFLSLAQQDT